MCLINPTISRPLLSQPCRLGSPSVRAKRGKESKHIPGRSSTSLNSTSLSRNTSFSSSALFTNSRLLNSSRMSISNSNALLTSTDPRNSTSSNIRSTSINTNRSLSRSTSINNNRSLSQWRSRRGGGIAIGQFHSKKHQRRTSFRRRSRLKVKGL